MPQAVALPLAFAGASAVGGAINAERQSSAQRRAVRQQEEANRLATSRAAAEQRRAEQEQRRTNRRQPDIGGILANEQRRALSGAGATTLSGAGGVSTDRLTLGHSSMLGSA